MKKYIQPQLQVHEITKFAFLEQQGLSFGGNGDEGATPTVKEEQATQSMWDLYE